MEKFGTYCDSNTPSTPSTIKKTNNNQEGGATLYSAYFTPWWRQYYGGPYYGTGYDELYNWPYYSYWRRPYDYNYYSYWRRPHYYNYWRRPYYYRRPVQRPYVRDSIIGRRLRKKIPTYRRLRDE